MEQAVTEALAKIVTEASMASDNWGCPVAIKLSTVAAFLTAGDNSGRVAQTDRHPLAGARQWPLCMGIPLINK